VQTVDASRLMGASVIITGLSPEIAQTLVTIGVDLSKMNTIGDLQGGLEEAERLLLANPQWINDDEAGWGMASSPGRRATDAATSSRCCCDWARACLLHGRLRSMPRASIGATG